MKTALAALLLALFCINADAADADPVQVIRNAMIQQLLNGDKARLKHEFPADPEFIKKAAPEWLGTDIKKSVTEITGATFEIESPKHQKRHAGVWIFSYPDNKTALRDGKRIRHFCRGNYFKAKLLTFFSSTIASNKIIIVFSENTGDEKGGATGIINFIQSVPGLFARSSP